MNEKQINRHFLITHFSIGGLTILSIPIAAFALQSIKGVFAVLIVGCAAMLINLARCIRIRDKITKDKLKDLE